MTRILMITPIIKSQRGNAITATRLYNGLSRRGYVIDLLSMDEADWSLQLERCTRSHSYSLVHGLHAWHFSPAAQHPAIKNLPLLLTTTGTDINYDLAGPHKEQTLDSLLKASRIVVFNAELGRYLTAAESRLEPRLVVIPQGMDLPAAPVVTRRELGLSETDTIFIVPSGLRPVKNLDLALDGLAIAHRSQPRLALLILGAVIDTTYKDHIKARLGELPWAIYLGEIPHQKIGGIMQAADVVLNTSWAEGQPQAALEAMSLGKPCILTAVPGNLGIIQDGIQGYYVNSASELAEAALKLIEDPARRYDMGSAARELVNDKYSAEKELDAYARLYEELM